MADQPTKHRTSIRETLTSITIAFAVAFVFRAFIIEAFVIPTGSMAPTLMGAHMLLHSDRTGYTWPVGPRHALADPRNPSAPGGPDPVQGRTVIDEKHRIVAQPMTGDQLYTTYHNEPLRAGDRILVLKYLFGVFNPQRFDVVVFKSPVEPRTNFIKRLVGLPGEQVSLIDGDVFVRDLEPPVPPGTDAWSAPGWTIARKPERVQRAVWQEVYDAAYTPRNQVVDGRRRFHPPWSGDGWQVDDRRAYTLDHASPSVLRWDHERWPIRDFYPYNDTRGAPRGINPIPRNGRFPVADLSLSAGVEPRDDGLAISAIIEARGHEFRASIENTLARLAMREAGGSWNVVATGELDAPLPPREVTNIEFWHVDQSLQMRVDGRLLASHEYDWTPDQRIRAATGLSIDELLARGADTRNPFAEEDFFRPVSLRWETSGAPVTLHRVAVKRDLYYQPYFYRPSRADGDNPRIDQPAFGTHPAQIATLSPDQFMVCGDNSPASSDSRLWGAPDPWVARFDPTQGVVPRELMIGRAFFVYFPAPLWRGSIPIPDVGRLRFIW